jgi:hypothetical protein
MSAAAHYAAYAAHVSNPTRLGTIGRGDALVVVLDCALRSVDPPTLTTTIRRAVPVPPTLADLLAARRDERTQL